MVQLLVVFLTIRLVLAGVLGREVPIQQANDETYARIMSSVVIPEPIVPTGWNSRVQIRDGAWEVESNDLQKLLGRTSGHVTRRGSTSNRKRNSGLIEHAKQRLFPKVYCERRDFVLFMREWKVSFGE